MAQKTIEQIKAEIEAKMAATRAEVSEKMERTKLELQLNMASNEDYITGLIKTESTLANLQQMKGMMQTLSSLPKVKLPTGLVAVNAFPTGKPFFGEELSHLIGLVTSLGNLFLDEHMLPGFAVVGTNAIEVERVQDAFGRPAYYSNKTGELTPEAAGDYYVARGAIRQFAASIGIDVNMSKFTKEAYDAYFAYEKLKATNRQADVKRALDLTKAPVEAGKSKLSLKDAEA